ncbi:hypothetical protein [Nostoc sp.]|uniref:hypothetical protein n=1 Tax=Nostoc sp. TaxID=1180 RepID=UPI002FF73EA3
MGIDTSPKTESDYSVWVFTGDIRATVPKPQKKSLAEILGAISINSATKESIEPAVLDIHHASGGRLYKQESPCLLSPGVGGRKFSVIYRAAGSDRIYTEESPTLRSLSNTGGNHQSGSGALKIREVCRAEDSGRQDPREYQGETYLERPINATEAEQLMGWEVGSTAIGINGEGDEITISQTQRIKMLGNGIIPAEITDILTAIKPLLERKLESEIPAGLMFAYRQLRQQGMSHQASIKSLHQSAPPH